MGSFTLTSPSSGYVYVYIEWVCSFWGDNKTLKVGINMGDTAILDDASVYFGRQDVQEHHDFLILFLLLVFLQFLVLDIIIFMHWFNEIQLLVQVMQMLPLRQ